MQKIEYLEELPESLQSEAVGLFLTALQDKLTPILGGGQRARRTLLEGMNRRRCLAAVEDGKLLGVLAVHTSDGGFIDPTFSQLRSIYGTYGALWRLVGMSALSYDTKEGEWHVEGVAVTDAARGRGIGTHLLSWFEKLAASARINRLTLQVINTNPRASKLYQRLGYRIVEEQKAWPINQLFGFPFQRVISMEKALAAPK